MNQAKLPLASELRQTHPELFELSNWRGFSLIIGDWAMIFSIAAACIYFDSWWVTAVGLLLIGLKQFSLAESTLHIASHNGLFKTKSLNKSMDFFFSTPFFWSVEGYRELHTTHHQITTVKGDPAFALYATFGLDSRERNVFWMIGRLFLGVAQFNHWFRYLPEWFLESKKQTVKITLFYFLFLTPFLYFKHLDYFLIYWLVPFLFIQFPLVMFNEVAEHYNSKGLARQRVGWIVNNFICHNDGYHFVHHKYPAIPWFNLKKAYAVLKPSLPEFETCHGFFFHPVVNMHKNRKMPFYPNALD